MNRERLFNVLSIIENLDLEIVLVKTLRKRERKLKNNKYKKLLILSNIYIYIDLYLVVIARK